MQSFNTKLKSRNQAAFTLVELLTVMGIIALLAALAAPALSTIKGNEVSQAVYNLRDVLDQARAYAMSKNTYVYVGIVQDSASSPSGSMIIGLIASSDGTQVFSNGNTSLSQNSPSFNQISKLVTVTNVQTVSLPSSSENSGTQRQVVPNSYKLADPSFNQGLPACSFVLGSYNFTSSVGMSNSPGVVSQGMLQIDPQGVVSEVGGSPVPFLEIGLKPVKGNQSNYAALQIAGLSGAVRIYRP